MDKLVRGVARFRQSVYLARREVYRKVLDRQQPHSLFITCSDSRLDPEALTQSGPGDIFVMRNAGNLIPAFGAAGGGEAATIEYAVAGLSVPHIVVCGHTGCGAMRALIDPAGLETLTETARWLLHAESTRRIAQGRGDRLSVPELWDAAVEVNVLVQLDHLRTHPAVAAALARRELKLYGWVFDLRSGEVRNFDPVLGRFVPLPDAADDQFYDLPPAVTLPPVAAHRGQHRPEGSVGQTSDDGTNGDGSRLAHT